MTEIPEALRAEFDDRPEKGTEDEMYGYWGTPIGYLNMLKFGMTFL